jgi:hypothetical protein
VSRAPDEADIQRALCIWLDGTPTRAPALRPGVVYWHTPNSGEGRSAFQGKILKQQGVKAGIPDLLFLWGGLYGLEMKQPGGVLNPAQRVMHPRLLAAGMVACVTRDSLEGAREVLREWGLISPGA